MLSLLLQGNIFLFAALLFTIVFSLTLHEFGHAASATLLGDDTAQRAGRLTLSPVAHIDPIGLLMVMVIGFGYAKPVPFNINNIKQSWGAAAIAAAGPAMNLVIAIISINLLVLAANTGLFEITQANQTLLVMLAQVNLLLMLFNLLPIGPLDGHYVMSWLLPRSLRIDYDRLNYQYGSYVFLGLILLSILGLPIFNFLMEFSNQLLPYLIFVS